jgi:hypothetical protein
MKLNFGSEKFEEKWKLLLWWGWGITLAGFQAPLGWFMMEVCTSIYSKTWCKQGEFRVHESWRPPCMSLYRHMERPKANANGCWNDLEKVWTCGLHSNCLHMKVHYVMHNWTKSFSSSKIPFAKSKHDHVSNGWKGFDVRNNCYVGQKSIWSVEIGEIGV